MADYHFTHDTTLEFPTPDHEDVIEIPVTLFLEGSPGVPSKISGPPEDCYEGWGSEIELDRIEIGDDVVCPRFLRPLPDRMIFLFFPKCHCLPAIRACLLQPQ